jgi:GntR family transcriptional regulator
MFLPLNPQSGLPLYRQMLQQLRQRIASGQLAPGTQLPSVRDLSAELGVNPLTAGKVYHLLEQEGLVEFRRGQGTFVTGGRKPLSPAAQQKLLQPALDQLVAEALELGVDAETLRRLLQTAYERRQP